MGYLFKTRLLQLLGIAALAGFLAIFGSVFTLPGALAVVAAVAYLLFRKRPTAGENAEANSAERLVTDWMLAGMSLIAAAMMYSAIWRIETYFGWCGNPTFPWWNQLLFGGALGLVSAARGLAQCRRSRGLRPSVCRIAHALALAGIGYFPYTCFAALLP